MPPGVRPSDPLEDSCYASHTVHDRRDGHSRPLRDENRVRDSRGSPWTVHRTRLPGAQDRPDRRGGIRGDRSGEPELGETASRTIFWGTDYVLSTHTVRRVNCLLLVG